MESSTLQGYLVQYICPVGELGADERNFTTIVPWEPGILVVWSYGIEIAGVP